MSKKGYSRQGMFGEIIHYDEHGKKIGKSETGIFGGYTNYDANGKKTGRSEPGIFGGYTNYDVNGHKTGRSEPRIFGGYNHYDGSGKKTGYTEPSLLDGYNHYNANNINKRSMGSSNSSQGCYIATAVYGSYDCPEVWTLRRYRDGSLASTWYGRAFIRTYYAISPALVKWFGHTEWFKKIWRSKLDRLVEDLQGKGFESTPYEDKTYGK